MIWLLLINSFACGEVKKHDQMMNSLLDRNNNTKDDDVDDICTDLIMQEVYASTY